MIFATYNHEQDPSLQHKQPFLGSETWWARMQQLLCFYMQLEKEWTKLDQCYPIKIKEKKIT